MNALQKIILAAAITLAPTAAYADFGHHGSRNDWQYRNYGYNYNHSYRNYPSGSNALRYGVRSGALSPREVRELQHDRREILQKESYYRADGRLSGWERNSLRNDWREYQSDLRHELRDGERRW